MKLEGKSGAVESELRQPSDGFVCSLFSCHRSDELRVFEEMVDKSVASRDCVGDSLFEILREALLPQATKELSGSQVLEFLDFFAESLTLDSILVRAGSEKQLRQFEAKTVLKTCCGEHNTTECRQEGSCLFVGLREVGSDSQAGLMRVFGLSHDGVCSVRRDR